MVMPPERIEGCESNSQFGGGQAMTHGQPDFPREHGGTHEHLHGGILERKNRSCGDVATDYANARHCMQHRLRTSGRSCIAVFVPVSRWHRMKAGLCTCGNNNDAVQRSLLSRWIHCGDLLLRLRFGPIAGS
ncbi:hypothetical protein D3870_13445 [Noviherbaspirillum cavernae]|uniref:Uncharacterized protein n=1 Tax=Noviherbaspirillum cavernae TaxID=2320862 RepID=A0A418X312_9BURK|nr:hypothetical protein D3870_13445 [Noviherbaspirillum cavernae]